MSKTYLSKPSPSQSGDNLASLLVDIDNNLAWQLAFSSLDAGRRNSTESTATVVVDMDETTGEMHVSHRNRDPSFLNRTFEDLDREVDIEFHHRKRGGLVVSGNDPATGFSYDYDGRVIHVHRDNHHHLSRRDSKIERLNTRDSVGSSVYSEYYAVDAETYETGADMLVVHIESETPNKGKAPSRKSKKVAPFMWRLLMGFEKCGVWERFKDEKKKKTKKKTRNKLINKSRSLLTSRTPNPHHPDPQTPLHGFHRLSQKDIIPGPITVEKRSRARDRRARLIVAEASQLPPSHMVTPQKTNPRLNRTVDLRPTGGVWVMPSDGMDLPPEELANYFHSWDDMNGL
ncbi:hypothetical protein DM02DRAFT_657745 [Periconia macrospinosa]|uniref:Uncharacterized protein n=1 Tax=Periconia macrospinosa TaxID=97972 RepID=A0A2V1DIW8_9PLEO|nr:hypothetical protein DM02DRAFT_657745 [Periconia macrospinosa]